MRSHELLLVSDRVMAHSFFHSAAGGGEKVLPAVFIREFLHSFISCFSSICTHGVTVSSSVVSAG